MKSNREQNTSNHKQKKICSEVQAITLHPRLHHYEGFHYPLRDLPQRDLHKEITIWSTQDRSTQLHQLNPLHKR